jgi:hypothetical protein
MFASRYGPDIQPPRRRRHASPVDGSDGNHGRSATRVTVKGNPRTALQRLDRGDSCDFVARTARTSSRRLAAPAGPRRDGEAAFRAPTIDGETTQPFRATDSGTSGLSSPVMSLEGPVETVDGELTVLIPLEAGGSALAPLAKGIGKIGGEFLKWSFSR